MRFVPTGAVYQDDDDKLRQESRNGIIQAQYVIFLAQNWTAESRLTSDIVLELQRLAVNQIYRCAGHFRDGPVKLSAGGHITPDAELVAGLVDEMCAYVNEHWEKRHALHVAAYLMWRLNWIHPFFGGNGRSSRSISYLIMCVLLGFVLPGEKAIPEFIAEERTPYYVALRDADAHWKEGRLDLTKMESLLSSLLAKQLAQFHSQVTGNALPEMQKNG